MKNRTSNPAGRPLALVAIAAVALPQARRRIVEHADGYLSTGAANVQSVVEFTGRRGLGST